MISDETREAISDCVNRDELFVVVSSLSYSMVFVWSLFSPSLS